MITVIMAMEIMTTAIMKVGNTVMIRTRRRLPVTNIVHIARYVDARYVDARYAD